MPSWPSTRHVCAAAAGWACREGSSAAAAASSARMAAATVERARASFTRPPRLMPGPNYVSPRRTAMAISPIDAWPSGCDFPPRNLGPDRGTTKISAGTDTATEIAAQRGPQQASLVAAAVGAALLAAAIYASLAAREWMIAGLAGAAGLALLRQAFLGALPMTPVIVDAVAFALFAYQRNDSLAFWQLAGSWADSLRLDVADATVAYCLYLGGALAALFGSARPLRPIEALGLVATPFLFKLVVLLGADWHMAEIGGLAFAFASFPVKVLVGRTAVLFVLCEAALQLLSLIGVGRAARRPALHGLVFALSAFAALTPLLANFAQVGASPIGRIIFGSLFAALAEAGLWGVVYFMTGLVLDSLSGRPPSLVSARANLRGGATRGAIYGGVFMLLILAVSTPLRAGGIVAFILGHSQFVAPLAGAIAFPLAQTLIGSADGTPPFVGRLRAAYGDARAWARGAVVGGGCWWAYAGDLVHAEPLSRFSCAFVIGAFAYAGVDALFDAGRIVNGQRRRMQSARVYWLGVLLGGFVAGALGWYFDAAQVAVVWNKFWAYSDANYRVTGRALGDFVTYPIFNKYGMINLGEVAGGVRLLYAESLSGVINWSFAAPLFAINVVFLSAILDRSLRPIRGLLSGAGAQGLVEGAVRVMRWGLWMAPIINTFLRQSADPSWYNQDGAVRSLVAIGADVGMPHAGFADFSLTMFIGLLAYDWLRVLIWFDHMGLRVATLVNLSFLGADRLDERAARFIGHRARTRAVPEAIRRFGTWAPLLIPFYIPRGAAWDKAWTGAEALSHGGPMPGAVKTLVVAYGVAGVAAGAAALALAARSREAAGTGTAGATASRRARRARRQTPSLLRPKRLRWLRTPARRPRRGLCRRRRARRLSDRPLPPAARSAAATRPLLLRLRERRRAVVDRLRAGPPRRRLRGRADRLQPLPIVNTVNGVRATMELGPDPRARRCSWRVRLDEPLRQPARAAADQLLRDRRPRDRRLCARSRFRRHACRDDVRARAQRDSRPQPPACARRAPTAARPRSSRSSPAPAPNSSATRIRARASSAKARSPGRPAASLALAQARRRRQALDLRPRRELHPRGRARGRRRGRGRVHHRPLRQRGLGGELIAERLGLPTLAESELQKWLLRDARGRAFAGAAPPLAVRLLRRRQVAASDPSHAAALGACDGERTRRQRGRQQRRRHLFRLRQRAPQRPDAVPLRQRDDAAAGADRLYPRPRRGRDRRAGFAPFQRADATIEIAYEPGVATFRQAARRSGDDLRRSSCRPIFPATSGCSTLANRGAKRDAPARRAVLRHGARREPQRERRQHLDAETRTVVLLFENRRNDFQRGVAFVATSLAKPATETSRRRFFGGAGTRHHIRRRSSRPAAATAAARRRTARGGFLRRDHAGAGSRDEDRDRDRSGAKAARPRWLRRARPTSARRRRGSRRRARIGRSGSARSRSRPTGRTSTGWSTPGCPISSTPRGCSAASGPTSAAALRLSRPVAGRAAADPHRAAAGARADRAARRPAVPRRRRAQMVASRAGRRHRPRPAHQGERSASLAALRARALCRADRRLRACSTRSSPYLEGPAVPEHEDTLVVAPRAVAGDGDRLRACAPRDRIYARPYRRQRPAAAAAPATGTTASTRSAAGHRHQRLDGLFPLRRARRLHPARARQGRRSLRRCVARTRAQALRGALEVGWRGDHYALDFADDGQAIDMPNAMTTGWAAYSGAFDFERAVAALEGGLKGIERPDRDPAAGDAVLRTFAALSRPHRRLSPGRARERRTIQPRRLLDRRRLPARSRRRRATGATPRPRRAARPRARSRSSKRFRR